MASRRVEIGDALQLAHNAFSALETLSARIGAGMIAVIATLYVRLDQIEAFEQTFVRLAQAVRANEEGNHLYQPTRVQGETGVYKVMELYDDADAIVAHRASEHFKEYSALLAPMFSGPADIIRMDVL